MNQLSFDRKAFLFFLCWREDFYTVHLINKLFSFKLHDFIGQNSFWGRLVFREKHAMLTQISHPPTPVLRMYAHLSQLSQKYFDIPLLKRCMTIKKSWTAQKKSCHYLERKMGKKVTLTLVLEGSSFMMTLLRNDTLCFAWTSILKKICAPVLKTVRYL